MDRDIVVGNKKYSDTGKSRYCSGYVVGQALPTTEEKEISRSEALEKENATIKTEIHGLQQALAEVTLMMMMRGGE